MSISGRSTGRVVPKKPKKPFNWKLWLIIFGVTGLIAIAVAGTIYVARDHTPEVQPGIPKTMFVGESIQISKICEGGTSVIMPFQLASVDETGQALFFHPNLESETVVETLKVGSQLYIDSPCGRYAAGIVRAVNFRTPESGQTSTVKLEMYRTLIPSDGRNPEQTAPGTSAPSGNEVSTT